MLTVVLGTDWVSNSAYILRQITDDILAGKGNRILIVPESISHSTERKLCAAAGDQASLYAEVLPFTRLLRRVSEYTQTGIPEYLDDGGRLVAMANSARQLHSRLKTYASVGTSPEFLTDLIKVVDEFKQCLVSSADLKRAAAGSEGVMAQKLEELSLLLETYDAVCARGKRDPLDSMNWLLEQLENCDFAHEHSIYIDGFPDFTQQHFAIITHFIASDTPITVSLNCDCVGSKKMAFEKAGRTAQELLRFAKENGIQTQVIVNSPRAGFHQSVADELYQGQAVQTEDSVGFLTVYRTENAYQECVAAAQKILQLVKSGVRYRDIGVAYCDAKIYQDLLGMVLRRCGIPIYVSGKDDILNESVIATVLCAIEAALGGFQQKDVVRYLKSSLSPLEPETVDILEHYAFVWAIEGGRWLKPWDMHPDGLGKHWSEEDELLLQRLNAAREAAITPLVKLNNGFLSAVKLKDQTAAVVQFLEDIRLDERLQELAYRFESAGDGRNAQILGQLWEILLCALEQLHDVLGETLWDADTFTRLLKLLLSQYSVGTIPPVLDAVTVSTVAGLNNHTYSHLFVLGAAEGAFPAYPSSSGVLSEQERSIVRNMGIPLNAGAADTLQVDFAEIYNLLCGVENGVYVSCPAAQPSFVYNRLKLLAGGETAVNWSMGTAFADPADAAALFARNSDREAAQQCRVSELYKKITQAKEHSLGSVSRDRIDLLYGKTLRLSASKIDELAKCRLLYFLKHGLRVQQWKEAKVDPAQFGTFVHDVLERTGRAVMERGGFHKVSLDDTLSIAGQYIEDYISREFSDVQTNRFNYLMNRNRKEVEMIVRELWEELHTSLFEPFDFELYFGDGGRAESVHISGSEMDAKLIGFVDRVDTWQHNGRNYFRIVDYKSGSKSFDYCDVLVGVGLQMLLYLYALQEDPGELLGKNSIPAGVQYFPAKADFLKCDALPDAENAQKIRTDQWKRSGLVLNDEDVLLAMDPEQTKRFKFKRTKDGFTGDIATAQQLKDLKQYIFKLLSELVDEVASGCISPNPYTRADISPCMYCPYQEICHPADAEQRRDYAAVKPERFWEQIEKEVTSRG